MTRRVEWKLRPSPPSPYERAGRPEQTVTVVLDDDQWETMRRLHVRISELEPGEERTRLVNESCNLMEMWFLFDAETVDADDAPEPSIEGAKEEPTEHKQTSLLPPPRGTAEFPIPEKARARMARASGYVERDNAIPSETIRNSPPPGQSALDQPGAIRLEAVGGDPEPVVEQAPVEPAETTPFDMTVEGWVGATPRQALRDRASERMRFGDDNKPNKLPEVGTFEDRERGFVAEYLFAEWLDQQGVAYTYDGGTNGAPDFVIAGRPVAVKCCGSKGAYSTSHRVFLLDAHFKPGSHDYFFFGCDKLTEHYLLLGFIEGSRFGEIRQRYNDGDEVMRGFIARGKLGTCRVTDLVRPTRWLDALREAAA